MPGIPACNCAIDLSVTLLEVTEKKVKFLRHAWKSLQLTNVAVLNQRRRSREANECKRKLRYSRNSCACARS